MLLLTVKCYIMRKYRGNAVIWNWAQKWDLSNKIWNVVGRRKKERIRKKWEKSLEECWEKEGNLQMNSSHLALGIHTHHCYFYLFRFTGYKPGICRQPNDVILTLKILIGAVPAILIFVGLFILLFYPITEESRRETKLALEVLR